MIGKERIAPIAQQWLEGKDMVLVSIKCSATNVIEVLVDSLSGIQIDKCIELSRFIESQLDREQEDFELTVSSYSVSEPFIHPIQFEKNIGRDVEVLMIESGLKIKGNLTSYDGESVDIRYEKKVEVEGKKRKQLMEFVDKISLQNVKSIKLSW